MGLVVLLLRSRGHCRSPIPFPLEHGLMGEGLIYRKPLLIS